MQNDVMPKLLSPAPPIRLRLHRYDGQEQGLMILATRESLVNLVTQIGEGLTTDLDATAAFPRLVASCEAVGLHNSETPYALSFHIDTEPPFRRRPWQRPFGYFWSFGLALAGAIAVLVLIAEHMRFS
jgi:hypothetical protein